MHRWKHYVPGRKRAEKMLKSCCTNSDFFVPVMPLRLWRKMSRKKKSNTASGKRAAVRCFPLNAVDRKERLLQTPSLTLRSLTDRPKWLQISTGERGGPLHVEENNTSGHLACNRRMEVGHDDKTLHLWLF